jgi:hypothetical protein
MVPATTTTPLTLTPNAVRYGLSVDRLGGAYRGTLLLQRAQRDAGGAWVDDPRAGARASAGLPASLHAALDGLLALVPAIASRLLPGLAVAAVTDVRLTLRSVLADDGTLDVSIGSLQCSVAPGRWLPVITVPSLSAFLAAHPDLIPQVGAAWAGLDAAVAAANDAEGWV